MTRMRTLAAGFLAALLPLALAACQQPVVTEQDLKPLSPGQQALNVPRFIPPSITVSVQRYTTPQFATVDLTTYGGGASVSVTRLPPGLKFDQQLVAEIGTEAGFRSAIGRANPTLAGVQPTEILPVRHERYPGAGFLMHFPNPGGTGWCTVARAYLNLGATTTDDRGFVMDTRIDADACGTSPRIATQLLDLFGRVAPMADFEQRIYDATPIRGPRSQPGRI